MSVATAAKQDANPAFLSVNNIEVVYSHVILVLKGVSLEVPKGGIVALLALLASVAFAFQPVMVQAQVRVVDPDQPVKAQPKPAPAKPAASVDEDLPF